MKKRFLVFGLVAAAAAAAFFLSPAKELFLPPVKFVVLGGTRGADNGIDTAAAGEMVDAVLKERPNFVLFTGDLIEGTQNYQQRLAQLAHWRAVFARPLAERGIKVYPVRGPHELPAGDPDVPDWGLVFSGDCALPGNGPYWEKYLSYTFTSGNVRIIAADMYLKRDTRAIDLSWMQEQLAENREPHLFVFAHAPLFSGGGKEPGELPFDPGERDRFIKMFTAAGGAAYICGRDPWFDRANVEVSSGTGRAYFHQLTVGPAGATARQWNAAAAEKGVVSAAHAEGYGYLVAEIKGNKGTLTFKRRKKPGVFVQAATFSYRVAR